jgi:AcrR family transcriptional regulator
MSNYVTRKKKRPRPYRSALRESHAERTKEGILAAAAEEMEERGPQAFAVPSVAARAGVALRTVYRHFPTRDALVDAMWAWLYASRDWLERDIPDGPIEETVARVGAGYAEMRALIVAAQRCERQLALRKQTRKRRMANFEAAFADDVAALGAEARRRALGALQCIATPTFWLMLNDSWCPDPAEASRVAAWAVGVLRDKIRSDPASVEQALGTATPTPSDGGSGRARRACSQRARPDAPNK